MSVDALAAYNAHLSEQLGVNGVFTEPAVYDPDDEALTLYGIYDDTYLPTNKDSANVMQKNIGARFIVKEVIAFDIYESKRLTLTNRSLTFTIDYVGKDIQGTTVLWLV